MGGGGAQWGLVPVPSLVAGLVLRSGGGPLVSDPGGGGANLRCGGPPKNFRHDQVAGLVLRSGGGSPCLRSGGGP